MRDSRSIGILVILTLAGTSALGLYRWFEPTPPPSATRPRLVVVLVFDQLRGDYLQKWKPLFGEGGFKRLMDEGAWFTNCHYPYALTVTAAGHASMLTGCTPRDHGIVANEWWDRDTRSVVSNVDGTKGNERFRGPQRRKAPTLGDVLLDLFTGSKVCALSIKDRSAILLAALRAQFVYWLSERPLPGRKDEREGFFETSLKYRTSDPGWVNLYNSSKKINSWVGRPWDKFRPDLDYVAYSGPDDVEWEGRGSQHPTTKVEQGRTFPHPTPTIGAVMNSPFGNEVLLDFTFTAITAEKLGQRNVPDLLCVSFSSNDLVGHRYGPDSQEVLDITLRSDRIVKDILDLLDEKVGKGNYAVALSADHGVGPIPEVAKEKGLDADYVSNSLVTTRAETFLKGKYGQEKSTWIDKYENYKLHLNPAVLKEAKQSPAEVEKALAQCLAEIPGVQAAFTRTQLLSNEELSDPLAEMVRQSCTPDSCGEVFLVLKKYWLPGDRLSSRKEKDRNYVATHGSPHDYDTHVPLLVMGHGIRPGVYEEKVAPQAMAFLLARILEIDPPMLANSKFKPPERVWK